MIKISNTQGKKLVTTEVIYDAVEIKSKIETLQGWIAMEQRIIEESTGKIKGFQGQINECNEQLSELKSVGIEPVKEIAVETLEAVIK